MKNARAVLNKARKIQNARRAALAAKKTMYGRMANMFKTTVKKNNQRLKRAIMMNNQQLNNAMTKAAPNVNAMLKHAKNVERFRGIKPKVYHIL
jgi:hypothetical protein